MSDDQLYEYLGQTFEWSRIKAAKNEVKHGVRFPEAATVFFDSPAQRSSRPTRGTNMKAEHESDSEMKTEYDFSKGARGAFTQSFRELNLISLDDDLRDVFPDSTAVNAALRKLLEIEKLSKSSFQKAS